jgi:hypothetical protein
MINNKRAESEGGLGGILIKAVLWMAFFTLLFFGVITLLKKLNII